jgi:hypothetical protein
MINAPDNAKVIDQIIKKYKYTIGAELGVRRGEFSAYLLQENPKLHMSCVDLWADNPALNERDQPHENNYKSYQQNNAPYKDRIDEYRMLLDDAVSLIREIGPVITALIFAGKVGSGIGAELASMNVTEQIDAMQVSDNNPFKYLVVTRVLAATLMLPILVILADGFGLLGSLVGVNLKGDVSAYLFFSQIFQSLEFSDLIPAIIKTFFFGYAIGLIGSYKGYNSNKGTEGVGEAANSAVVLSSLMVFIIDMIAVQITSLLQG